MFISASYLRRGRRWRIEASEEEGLLFRASPEVFLLANRGVGGRAAAVESSHLVPVAVESRRRRKGAPEGGHAKPRRKEKEKEASPEGEGGDRMGRLDRKEVLLLLGCGRRMGRRDLLLGCGSETLQLTAKRDRF
ncbi:unnamed protein product [Linum trigynum]|uniref:Uncharacterized protein n=1 Tax=Linum trigynum TaxID=586398 RepID=A0AAV2FFK3_9ROSI